MYVAGFFAHHNLGGNINFGSTTLNTFGGSDIFLAKYDQNGAFQWARHAGSNSTGSLGGEAAQGLHVGPDNNPVMTGWFTGTANFEGVSLTSQGDREIYIAKYSDTGALLWVNRAGGTGPDIGNDVSSDANGNLYVTGRMFSTSDFDTVSLTSLGGHDVFVAKYDSNGQLEWVRQAGGMDTVNYADGSFGISTNEAGDSYVTGTFTQTAYFGADSLVSLGDNDIFLAKY
ncbi:MAG: hypothetical protein AAF438_17070, partial [Pseudomonadota bacterium]